MSMKFKFGDLLTKFTCISVFNFSCHILVVSPIYKINNIKRAPQISKFQIYRNPFTSSAIDRRTWYELSTWRDPRCPYLCGVSCFVFINFCAFTVAGF